MLYFDEFMIYDIIYFNFINDSRINADEALVLVLNSVSDESMLKYPIN